MFSLLQETWHNKKIPNARAALFYSPSAISSVGFASKGEFRDYAFRPVLLERLRTYQKPPNFQIIHKRASSLSECVDKDSNADFWFFTQLHFGYDLFQEGKSWGIEETPVNHQELRKLLNQHRERQWILGYYYHPALSTFFKGNRLTFIDYYGNTTSYEKRAHEVVITNF